MVVVVRLTEQVCQHLSSHIFHMFLDRPSIGKARSPHPEDTYHPPTPTRHRGTSPGHPGSLVSDKHPAYLLLVLCQSFLLLDKLPSKAKESLLLLLLLLLFIYFVINNNNQFWLSLLVASIRDLSL